MTLLSVKNLTVTMHLPAQTVYAVDDISFDLQHGEILGIVGESGSGKTQAMLAMLGLHGEDTNCTGSVDYSDNNILRLPRRAMNHIRGSDIAMIFQDPMSSLNPYLRISTQLIEAAHFHQHLSRSQARQHAIDILVKVNIPNAAQRVDDYPHQFSGGMRQRIMIAMALLRKPKVLIADEPTTSLDVTVQAEILTLLMSLKNEFGVSIILITHDLGVVAATCDRVLVMYAGKIVEQADVTELFDRPLHPYTQGLLKSARSVTEQDVELYSIEGNPPQNSLRSAGCAFYPRCDQRMNLCKQQIPILTRTEDGRHNEHKQACHLYNE